MGWYRRLIYDVFRRYNRKTCPVEFLFSRSNPTRSSISQPILRNSVLQNVVKNNRKKSPNFFAKRLYSADRKKVNHHLKAKEFGRWYENPRNLIRLGILGCGATCVYYWNLETVPYTKRRHLVFLSTSLEKEMGEFLLELCKSEVFEWKILPSHHPESIRVEKIGQDIIGALLKGLNKLEDDEQTCHLEEFKWEFLVVDDPTTVNSLCIPGGKIVVFTGLLNFLNTDAEIATIIGHEVAHAVARHSAEKLWLVILQFFISDLLFKRKSDLFRQRNEMEADYIGLLLSASAGYDPRTAPEVYVKLEYYYSRSIFSTHPHGKKRAEQLSQPKVMEEALSIYREALKDKDKDKEGERDAVGYLNFLNKLIGIF